MSELPVVEPDLELGQVLGPVAELDQASDQSGVAPWDAAPRADQEVGDPAFVGRASLVAAEGPLVSEQLGPRQASLLQLFAQRALGNANAMTREQHLDDVSDGSGRLFEPQPDRLLDERAGVADAPLV